MVQLICKDIVLDEQVLRELQVNAHDVVENLDRHNGYAQKGLRHDLRRLFLSSLQRLIENT